MSIMASSMYARRALNLSRIVAPFRNLLKANTIHLQFSIEQPLTPESPAWQHCSHAPAMPSVLYVRGDIFISTVDHLGARVSVGNLSSHIEVRACGVLRIATTDAKEDESVEVFHRTLSRIVKARIKRRTIKTLSLII